MHDSGMDTKKKKIKAALLGCTGLVGQQFIRMLDGHPYFEMATVTASPHSAGKKYGSAVAWSVGGEVPEFARGLEIQDSTPEAVRAGEARVVFSALPSAAADRLEPELRRQGLFVFSNASSRRLDGDVPVMIPEVNPAHLDLARGQASVFGGAILANSNCSTSGLVMVLKPLEALGLESVTVSTYQAISGAGRRGLAAMDIAANVIPYIRDEEEKMARESKKILGRLDGGRIVASPLEVNASCCRVPVLNGHLLSLKLDFSRDVEVRAFKQALSGFRGLPQEMELPTAPERPLIVRLEEDRPQPVLDVQAGRPERARGMAVTVGRVRGGGRGVNCWALVHNTIRGAAGSCLLNAELALRQGLFQ
jgi:aspartate-semialdehyde dehydrogenase